MSDEPAKSKDKTKRLTQKVWSQIDTETDRPLKDKEQVVGSRRQRLTARFLNGRPVGVVWSQFKSQSGNWKSTGWLINARGGD